MVLVDWVRCLWVLVFRLKVCEVDVISVVSGWVWFGVEVHFSI